MRLVSTMSGQARGTYTFREALFRSLAPDGGLLTPQELRRLNEKVLYGLRGAAFPDVAFAVALHLLEHEVERQTLEEVVRDALNFPVPLVELEPGVNVLELFHGPTLAFKDIGARFMAGMMSVLRAPDGPTLTILVATSGDTGGAVAQAFLGVPGTRVVVLFPEGKVSSRQEVQFTTLGENVRAVGVNGTFDDCQRLVRAAFLDDELQRELNLVSANSINVGRLLPQIFYHVYAWAALPEAPEELVVSVPSGNFGNLTAGLMARAIGTPVSRFVAATNANSVVPEYLATGVFRPRPSVPTLSSAMDVGDPSNFHRMLHLVDHDVDAMREVVTGSVWTDDQTRSCISQVFRDSGVVLDPHGAVGLMALREEMRRRPGAIGTILATAHPAKFAETVEPLIGRSIPLPPTLKRRLGATRSVVPVEPHFSSFRRILLEIV